MLPKNKMTEAEVSLRLAIDLIERGHIKSDVKVAIDGAQIQTNDRIHFPIVNFLESNEWTKIQKDSRWQGTCLHPEWKQHIVVHSSPGRGDTVNRENNVDGLFTS
jgi:hypothetical protein